MSSEDSVTRWLEQIPEGDDQAIQQLWDKYFHRLVHLARAKLQNFPKRAVDEEDLAVSAFDSFCRGMERGQYPQLENRTNLWSLLATMIIRKVLNHKRNQQRLKRGGGLDNVDGPNGLLMLEEALAHEPGPEEVAELAEECQRLLNKLPDEEVRRLAVWKMEGFTNIEIADKLSCSVRKVERKLELIRVIWGKEDVG